MASTFIQLPPQAAGGGSVNSVTATAPIASTGGTDPDISISQAATDSDGYLSEDDWNSFNGKIDRPELFFFVGSNGYDTIQSAIDAAELLPEADSTGDPEYQSGIEIFIPAGFYDESISINKNVNLTGLGGWATQINQVGIRPFSDTNGPQNITLKNLFINGLFITNETQGGGVFNLDMGAWAIRFDDCLILGVPLLQNIINIEFQTCKFFGDFDILNTASIEMYNTFSDSAITYTMNSALSHKPNGFADPNGVQYYNCNLNGIESVTTMGSTVPAILTSIQSTIIDLTLGDGTQTYLQGGAVQNLTDNGTEFLYYQCDSPYTPDQPTDWDTQPVTVNSALDQLAARVRALE